jgi:adenylate cyclase
MASKLTAEALADQALTTRERIQQLTDLGLIGASGRYRVGDVHRVRLVGAFEAAGVPADALARASEKGTISLDFYDRFHQDPGESSERPYFDLVVELGDRAPQLQRVFAAVGLAEPGPEDRISIEDESLLRALLDALGANRHPDLAIRALHVLGDSARRASEAAMSVFEEAVERAGSDIADLAPQQVYERFLEPWGGFARLVPRLAASLHARHLGVAVESWTVEETERLLAESGFVAAREVEQPAVAFVDLTAFTSLAEQRGDEAAAAIAVEFTKIASEIIERRQGRVVKQLGDGVLARFPDIITGVDATLDLLDTLETSTLPSAHAGIEAGPLIVREGDVFGRTVNRASRIADVAGPGQLLASQELTERLPSDLVHVEPAGVVALQGIDGPSSLVQLTRI